jgi:hypothetical protein
MTPNTPTPTYGEPWKPLQPDLIYDSYSHWMADAFNPAIRDRILACVNACAGMVDPDKEIAALKQVGIANATMHLEAVDAAAEIAAMRKAIREAHEALSTCKGFIEDAHIVEGQWHWEPVRVTTIALAKLKPYTTHDT